MVPPDTKPPRASERYSSTCDFHRVRLKVPSGFFESAAFVRLTMMRILAWPARSSWRTMRLGSAR